MMNKIGRLRCPILILCGLFGCSGGDNDSTPMQPRTPVEPAAPPSAAMNAAGAGVGAAGQPAPSSAGEAGLHRENGSLVFRTEPFTVPAGEERYLCWALTTQEQEELKVNAIDFPGAGLTPINCVGFF